MSIESAKKFIETVKADKGLYDRVYQASSQDEGLQIAREAGYTFTLDEWVSAKGELTDDELEHVAGGGLSACCCWG